MGIHSEAGLNRKFIDFAKLLNVYLNHFPKHERYGLALQIRQAAYDTYALIVECQKRYHKKTTLTNLDVRHEQLRMLLHLAHSLGYFSFKDGAKLAKASKATAEHRHLAISRQVDELGRMIGGWLVSERARESGRETP